MRRRRSRETTGRERSRLFFCCCCRVRALHQFDATAAGMNLKQFNFYSTRRVNCLLVEKRQPGLGSQTPPKKKRQREKKRRERRIFCDTSARYAITKMFLRVDESFFYSFTTQKRGKGRQKRARVSVSFSLFREREERDSFVVVVSLTSFTSSSPGHHP